MVSRDSTTGQLWALAYSHYARKLLYPHIVSKIVLWYQRGSELSWFFEEKGEEDIEKKLDCIKRLDLFFSFFSFFEGIVEGIDSKNERQCMILFLKRLGVQGDTSRRFQYE